MVVIIFFVLVIVISSAGGAAAACTGQGGAIDPEQARKQSVAGFTGEQLVNAAHIMNAANTLQLGRPGQVVGVMVAMGESTLTVLDRGDTAGPDSRGLFQQRDNGAWGTYTDRMDPTISATNFFTALIGVPGWETLSPTLAAHKVQRNADPYHYESYFAAADAMVTALTGDSATGSGCAAGEVVFPLSAGFNMTSGFGARSAPTAGASSWHPAVDLQHYPNPCGDQIYAITSGTVTAAAGYQVTIKSPAGYDVTYLHMKLSEVSVTVGEPITANQPIALVGSEGPSTGCHLDLRINNTGTTDTAVAALPDGASLGGPLSAAGFVDPEQFYALFNLDLCSAQSCSRNY